MAADVVNVACQMLLMWLDIFIKILCSLRLSGEPFFFFTRVSEQNIFGTLFSEKGRSPY